MVGSISNPVKIYSDNASAVFYSKNNKGSSDSKDIEIKYLLVRDKIKERHAVIECIGRRYDS